jgi:hypothetical protein
VTDTTKTILTHPGGAHKDDFLACSVLVHTHGAPVVRREPEQADLDDPNTIVVDVGGEHDPARGNFDHHQLPRDSVPTCALSLVLLDLGLYDDARTFCDWLEPAEWLDCRGPVDTAKWMGVKREVIDQLVSPIDITLLRRFAASRRLTAEDPIWQVMRMIGEDLVAYVRTLRERLSYIESHAEFWNVQGHGGATFEVLYMPRTDPLPEETSAGLERFIEQSGKAASVVALVYPDRRGSGYGMSRYRDSPAMDFVDLEQCADVHFAHTRGFVAKTSATEADRLRELLALAYVGTSE